MPRNYSTCLLGGQTYKPYAPAPDGYLEWHEWAKQQHAHGLRQAKCHTCGRWRFPQEKCCNA